MWVVQDPMGFPDWESRKTSMENPSFNRRKLPLAEASWTLVAFQAPANGVSVCLRGSHSHGNSVEIYYGTSDHGASEGISWDI